MKSKMSEVLNKVADYYLLLDTEEDEEGTLKGYYVDYSDQDIMNATFVFSHIVGNRFYKKGGERTLESAKKFGNDIHELVKKYADFNTKEFYKDK